MTSFFKSRFDGTVYDRPKGLLPYRHCTSGCVMSFHCLMNPLPEEEVADYMARRYTERFFGFVCKHCGRVFFVTDGSLWEGPRVNNAELVAMLNEEDWESIPPSCRRTESNMYIRVWRVEEPPMSSQKCRIRYECPNCKSINYS